MAKSDKLTRREDMFCEEYVASCFNGAEAARRVGYDPKSAAKAAHRLLSKPQVLARVDQIREECVERTRISTGFVITQTVELLQKTTAAVPVMEWDYSEHCMKETGFYQVDSKGAAKCLELLAKFQGMDGKKAQDEDEGPVFFKEDIPEPEGEDDG